MDLTELREAYLDGDYDKVRDVCNHLILSTDKPVDDEMHLSEIESKIVEHALSGTCKHNLYTIFVSAVVLAGLCGRACPETPIFKE